MPPRKSTSSVTPVEPDEPQLQQSPQAPSQTDKNVTATEQQLKARAEAGVSVDDYLLPRSLTVRLAKGVLPPNTTIQKDAVLAIQKAATVFVSYLSSHANESTLKRTVAPTDVFNALTELEFDSFRSRLEQELEAYTETKAGKRKSKKSDVNGAGDASGAPTGAGADGAADGAAAAATRADGTPRDEDDDVDMVDNPAKKVKRADDDGPGAGGEPVDGDETQEEELEEDEEQEQDHEDEEEDEQEDDEDEEEDVRRPRLEDDVDRVEDLDRDPGAQRGPMDPDADETDDEDAGPASQLRDDLGLG